MSNLHLFPSADWCRALSRALQQDPAVQAALVEFGPFTAGAVVEKGAGLQSDFCVHVEVAPGREPRLTFCDDEDELEELEPDYLAHAAHALVRDLLLSVQRGETPDPLRLVTSGQVKLRGDLGRVVRVAGRHPLVGLETLRAMPTRTL